MAANDVKYVEEASKVLSVPTIYLEGFIDFITKLDDEKLHMLLNSSQTGITENIGKFLYNLHYHHIIKFNTDEGGLKRFSEDEISRLVKYVNNVAEKINNIKQEKEVAEESEMVKEKIEVALDKEELVEEAEVVEEEPSSVLDGIDTTNMTDSQKTQIAEISELENKKQEKEQELDVAQKKLEELRGKYAVKDNLYTTAVYGLKARCEAQIVSEESRINKIMDLARQAEKELKRQRNKKFLKDIFSKSDSQKDKKGFFGTVASNWVSTKDDYAEKLENIRAKRNEKIAAPSEEIRKQNIAIEEAKKGLRIIGKTIKEQEEKIKDIEYEIYEIKVKIAMAQRLLEKPIQQGLLDKPIKREDFDLGR